MNKSPKTTEQAQREIIRRAHESMAMGNTQAVRECRRALETLTGKAR